MAAHAVVVVAADGADRKSTMETNDMIPKTLKTTIQIFLAALLACTLLTPTLSFSQQPSATPFEGSFSEIICHTARGG